jgi:hypothetical protein
MLKGKYKRVLHNLAGVFHFSHTKRKANDHTLD